MAPSLKSRPLPRVNFAATMSDTPARASEVAEVLTRLPGGVVPGGEIIVLAIKPSMWRPLFDSAAWLVTTCLLAATLTWMKSPIPGLSLTLTAQLIMLVGLARLGLAIVRWVPTWYLLTNRRVMTIHGVRTPRIASSLLVEVRNTYLIAAPIEKLANTATISFVTDHPAEPPLIWRTIAKPNEIHAKVRRAIESAIDQSGLGT